MSHFLPNRTLLLTLLLAVFVGCGRSERVEHPTGDDPDNLTDDSANTVAAQRVGSGEQAAGPDSLAEEKQGILSIEGAQEPVTLKLFRTPETFAVPFYTYHPADMVGAVIPSDISQTVRFTANFGGRLTNDAYVEFFYYPGVKADEDLRAVVREKAGDLGQIREGEKLYAWSIAEYPFHGDRLVGRYVAAKRGGDYFHILIANPPEMSEGLGARLHLILSEWRWAGGTPLMGR